MAVYYDADRENPLFAAELMVQIARGDEEQHAKPLEVRVLRAPGENIIAVEIADPSDAYFFYVCAISEAEYPALKRRMQLHVDFSRFPAHLVEILNEVARGEDFMISLQLPSTQRPRRGLGAPTAAEPPVTVTIGQRTTFRTVEVISIPCASVSHEQLARFLAHQLSVALTGREAAEEESRRSAEQVQELQDQTQQLREQLAEQRLRAQHELDTEGRRREQVQEQARTQAERAREEARREVQELQLQLEQVRAELDRAREDGRRQAERGHELEATIRSTETELETERERRRSVETELRRQREEARVLSGEHSQTHARVSELTATVKAMEQRLQDKDRLVERAEDARAAEAHARATAEEGWENEKRHAEKQRQKIADAINRIHHANRIISELDERTREVTAERDEAQSNLEATRQQLLEANRATDRAQAETESARREVATLRRRVAALEGELEDARKELASNSDVIRWLNSQLTEQSLDATARPEGGRGGGMGGVSMYSTPGKGVSMFSTPAAPPVPSPSKEDTTPMRSFATRGAGVTGSNPYLSRSPARLWTRVEGTSIPGVGSVERDRVGGEEGVREIVVGE